jgi:hypothetical protein
MSYGTAGHVADVNRSCTTMLLRHLERLCVILSCSAVAASQNASPTVTSTASLLPDVLQRAIPACAQACVQSSLSQQFPVSCTIQGDTECLCSRYGLGGESLGEIALGCVYTSCRTVDRSAASAYNVCLGQKNAVLPTKTALTIVTSSSSTPTSSKSSALSKVTSSVTSITSITRTTLQTRISTQSIFPDSVSSTPSATSSASSTSTPVALPAVEEDKPRMTPAQIAGLSVAAVAAFIIAIGLMALSVFLRKRKERNNRFSIDEKRRDRRQRHQSVQISIHPPTESRSEPPARFPTGLSPAPRNGYPRLVTPSPDGSLRAQRPAQRLGVGTSISPSNSSTPLDQIGLAISGTAELEGCPAHPQATQPKNNTAVFRPISTMTQATVFEEDEPATRRSSRLLPTPPRAVPPIRSLQPSRPVPKPLPNKPAPKPLPSKPAPKPLPNRPEARNSELFLNIPPRHGGPRPKRIVLVPSTQKPTPASLSSLSQQARSASASTHGSGSSRDQGYYLGTEQESTAPSTPSQSLRARHALKNGQGQFKKAPSTISRTVSRTVSRSSTNIRDSVSSQTSFETADPNDPTPDNEDDKRFSGSARLSPVAESPISNLRYPKVPRTTNQFVPRSPASSTQRQRSQSSLRHAQEPPSLLVKRRGEQQAQDLEARLHVHPPVLGDPFVSPARKPRSNVRIPSAESWTQTPQSMIDRNGKGRSSFWEGSPYMDELDVDVVRPLNIKRNTGDMSTKQTIVDAMKSPVWIPHLTPTRKGDDLFISVGWGDGGR